MASEHVRSYFQTLQYEEHILTFSEQTATVVQAANALQVIPARIAKTLSFYAADGTAFLVVAAGDAKIDNAAFKAAFQVKAKMLSPDDVLTYTGHPIGGVCPFALATNMPVFLDISLKRFQTVFPACGTANSAIELTCSELKQFSDAKDWVNVCKAWDAELK
ncbi:YbaK/EbsC family protein [Metasolibacillus meyeri]|uniref:YbaK/EbsC family protein n=1 Tax=Metasolibacillus meyeri TaxID=1071052 RepID=A0AAW9NK35_9BACL|nr:YbaK/EbsC family protein [Metasolibacillus meyeri]MEC1177487.1 YbaK/EbsC family protein [Metasolibacillus meyeri]